MVVRLGGVGVAAWAHVVVPPRPPLYITKKGKVFTDRVKILRIRLTVGVAWVEEGVTEVVWPPLVARHC